MSGPSGADSARVYIAGRAAYPGRMTGSLIPDPLALILSASALGQALLLAVLALSRTGHPAHRRWLAAIFLALGLLAIGPVAAALAASAYPLAMGLVLLALYTLPPMVWHYVASLTATAVQPPVRRGHMIGPMLGLAGWIAIISLPAPDRMTMFVDGDLPGGTHAAGVALTLFILVIAWSPFSAFYAWQTLRRLQSYQRALKRTYSNMERRDLSWVRAIILVIAAIWVLSLALLLADNLVTSLPLPASLGPALILALLLAFAVRGLAQTPGFSGEESEAVSETSALPKYAKSALDEEQAQRIAGRLTKALRDDRLYLDPGLSLHKLARHVTAPPNLVSQTLNQALETTFFDYVNRWRIEAALPRIAANEETVLTIALDVGFNSRSTFYTAFRQVTGQTPRSYRASLTARDD